MSEHGAAQEVLRLERLTKRYNVGKPTEIEVLHGLDLRLARSDFVALVGASGSGKSTLLNVIGLLDRPTSGELYLLGAPTRDMGDAGRTGLRGHAIGFVFQFHHLIQAFTALENVLMPLMVTGGKPDAGMWRAAATCWRRWDWRAWRRASRTSCPAASSSAWRWRARW